jgi:hypothetical protein
MGDMLREYRGDPTTAWVSAGFDATEIGLLSELYWGLPMRSYSRTGHGATISSLPHTNACRRGLVDDTGFTDAGRAAREDIELHTDAQMSPAITALGDDADELLAILQPWGTRSAPGSATSAPVRMTSPMLRRADSEAIDWAHARRAGPVGRRPTRR